MSISVSGKLENAKAGPKLGKYTLRLPENVDEDDFLGKHVEATGIFSLVEHNEPLVNEKGEYRAGMMGTEHVLTVETIKLL
jgi:hypothetical protein